MNTMVKRACVNAIAVKAKMDNVVAAHGYDATPVVEEILTSLLCMDYKTYADIAAESETAEAYNHAYVQWREMVAYNSSVFGATMRWAIKVSPEAADRQKDKPIWDMVDLDNLALDLLPYAKSKLHPMAAMSELTLLNMVRKDLHMMLMLHASDNNPINEELLSKIVANAYGLESVEDLMFLTNPNSIANK